MSRKSVAILYSVVVLFLILLGIMAVYTTTCYVAKSRYLILQTIWIMLGAAGVAVLIPMPPAILAKYSKHFLILVSVLLYYLVAANLIYRGTSLLHHPVILPFAKFSNGAWRWLGAGPVTIQPAEFAKFGLILFLTSYYGSQSSANIGKFKEGFFIPALWSVIVLIGIFGGRSLSNTILTSAIMFGTMYLAGVKTRYLLLFIALGLACAVLVIACTPFRRQRIVNHFFKKQTVQAGQPQRKTDNYQLDRAQCALGSGGIFGRGLANGRLKHKSIPEARTDFIFAVIGEEFGLLGLATGITLYLALAVLSYIIGHQAGDKQSILTCYVIGSFIPLQAFLNIGVISGFLPTTGVTAPLISYGGSSLLSIMLCIGLVANVCHRNVQEQQIC